MNTKQLVFSARYLSLVMFVTWFLGMSAVGCGSQDLKEQVQEAGGLEKVHPPEDAGVQVEKQRESSPSRTCSLKPVEKIPPKGFVRCSKVTAACLRKCDGASQSCSDACLFADKSPRDPTTGMNCSDCTSQAFMACLDNSPCKKSLSKYRCCMQQECPSYQASCSDKCEKELRSMYACSASLAVSCLENFYYAEGGCFPVRYDTSKCKDTKIPPLRAEKSPPVCSEATTQCVKKCRYDDVDCQFTCMMNDKTPPVSGLDCSTCAYNEYYACLVKEGCEKEVKAQRCCEAQNCSTAQDYFTCSSLHCSKESASVDKCGESKAEKCGRAFSTASSSCFPLKK